MPEDLRYRFVREFVGAEGYARNNFARHVHAVANLLEKFAPIEEDDGAFPEKPNSSLSRTCRAFARCNFSCQASERTCTQGPSGQASSIDLDKNDEMITALQVSIVLREGSVVTRLLETGLDVNANHLYMDSLLTLACRYSDASIMKSLIDSGLRFPSIRGPEFIEIAAHCNQMKVLEVLYRDKSTPKSVKRRPNTLIIDVARTAISHGNLALVKDMMLQYCLRRDPSGRVYFRIMRLAMLAAAHGLDDVLTQFLEKRGIPRFVVPLITPLSSAIHGGHLSTCRLLIQYGAGHHLQENEYHYKEIAAIGGNVGVFKLLINYGLEIPNANDIIAIAAQHCHSDLMKFIVESGYDQSRAVSKGLRQFLRKNYRDNILPLQLPLPR